jgi:hypothetical protein
MLASGILTCINISIDFPDNGKWLSFFTVILRGPLNIPLSIVNQKGFGLFEFVMGFLFLIFPMIPLVKYFMNGNIRYLSLGLFIWLCQGYLVGLNLIA